MTMNTPTPTLWTRFMQWANDGKYFSEAMKIQLYPPFLIMRVKVEEISNGARKVRIRLPLNWLSRNPGGVMFGGFQACVADPFPAHSCSRIFKGYSVWTRGMSLQFDRGSTGDLLFKFDMTVEQEENIRRELEEKGRSTPTFECAFYDIATDKIVSRISNTVAIRPKGYLNLADDNHE